MKRFVDLLALGLLALALVFAFAPSPAPAWDGYCAPAFTWYGPSTCNGRWFPAGNYAWVNGCWYRQGVGYEYGTPIDTCYSAPACNTQYGGGYSGGGYGCAPAGCTWFSAGWYCGRWYPAGYYSRSGGGWYRAGY